MKFRLSTRLIAGVVLIEIVMLSILVWNSVRLISSSHAERMELQVSQDAKLLANSLAPGLAAADRAVLLDVLSLLDKEAFTYVGVYDIAGYLLAERGTPPEYSSPDTSFKEAKIDGIYDYEASVDLAGQTLGKVKVGVSLEEIEHLIASTRLQNTLIAFVEIILSITVTLLLALVLTRHLRKLEEGAAALARGELNYRIEIDSTDEIGDLARGFNDLAKHLSYTQAILQQEHAELQRKENELAAIIDNIPGMLFVKDAENLHFLRCNKSMAKLLKQSEQALIGKSDYDLFPEEQADFFTVNDRQVLHSDEILDIPEEPIDTPEGTRYLHTRKVAIKDETGKPIMLLGVSEDITDRKTADEKLRDSEEKYRLAMDAAQDGIWDWNVITGKVEYSANWQHILGEPLLTDEYSDWQERIHPDDKEHILVSLEQHLQGQTDFWLEEHRLKHVSGGWKWVLGRGRVTDRDEDGGPLRMVGTMIDISRQKKLEEELQQHRSNLESLVELKTSELHAAKDEAERANREKSRFLANMSHELRTPMHAIMSFSSLGIKRTDDDKVKRYLDNIHTSGERLTKLLDDLLDLSKLESGKLAPEFVQADLAKLVDKVIEEIGVLLQKKNISLDFSCNRPVILPLDEKLITQVIVNLISNAIKFSPENSVIDISISEQDKHELVFSVADEGVGIPGDELKDVFDSFVQSSKTRSDSGGTGLGLPISKEIIELHNGRIWAESPPAGRNVGTVIYFQIPLKQLPG